MQTREPKEKQLKPMEVKVTIRKNGTRRVQFGKFGPSKTDSSFAEESDVNHIMQKFTKTGQITHLNQQPGRFADITEVSDLMGAYEIVKTASAMFDALPAAVRAKFHNSPFQLEEWLSKPENVDEAIELGLMNPKTKTAASPVPTKKGTKSSAAKPAAEETDEE